MGSSMPDEFHAGVEKAYGAAGRHRNLVDKLGHHDRLGWHARDNPELPAARIVKVVPECLREKRATALKLFGIDLADAEAVRNFEASSVTEWQVVSWLATYYQIYSAFLRLVGRYFEDPNPTGPPKTAYGKPTIDFSVASVVAVSPLT